MKKIANDRLIKIATALRQKSDEIDEVLKDLSIPSIVDFLKDGKTPNQLPASSLFENNKDLYPELVYGFSSDPTEPAILAWTTIPTGDTHDKILTQIFAEASTFFKNLETVPDIFKQTLGIEEISDIKDDADSDEIWGWRSPGEPPLKSKKTVTYQGSTNRYGGTQYIYLNFEFSRKTTDVFLQTSFWRTAN